LPVIYVFGKKPIDVDDCVSSLVDVINPTNSPPGDEQTSEGSTVSLGHDVAYTHVAGNNNFDVIMSWPYSHCYFS
jgi:diphthamide biosynthesis protein 2